MIISNLICILYSYEKKNIDHGENIVSTACLFVCEGEGPSLDYANF